MKTKSYATLFVLVEPLSDGVSVAGTFCLKGELGGWIIMPCLENSEG